MGSQQLLPRQQKVMPATSAEPGREVPGSSNGGWPEQLPANQQLLDVDQTLYNVSGILDSTRKVLAEFSVYARRHTTYEHAYLEERRIRIECAQAYEILHTQYRNAMNDLCGMHQKCLTLHQELEGTQETIQSLQSAIQEHPVPSNDKGTSISQSDWDVLERDLEKERLEARITELEKEKSEMALQHQNALINAVDHIREVKQRNDELEQLHGPFTEQVQTLAPDQTVEGNHVDVVLRKQSRASRGRKQKQAARKMGEDCSTT